MPKQKKIKNNKEKNVNKINKIIGEGVVEEAVVEVLPEDVKQALGIAKPLKESIKDVDYISELESGVDDFDFDDGPKGIVDDEFDSDLD